MQQHQQLFRLSYVRRRLSPSGAILVHRFVPLDTTKFAFQPFHTNFLSLLYVYGFPQFLTLPFKNFEENEPESSSDHICSLMFLCATDSLFSGTFVFQEAAGFYEPLIVSNFTFGNELYKCAIVYMSKKHGFVSNISVVKSSKVN